MEGNFALLFFINEITINTLIPYFKNILIPVDFTVNTDAAINNAIAVADAKNTIFHLMHVEQNSCTVFACNLNGAFVTCPVNSKITDFNIKEQLDKLKRKLLHVNPHLVVQTYIEKGKTVKQAIIDQAKAILPDLIVISKRNGHSWPFFSNRLNCSLIARETKCAILNVTPGTLLTKLKTIVIPLRSFLPGRKLALLSAVTRNQKPTVHLVTMFNKNPDPIDSEVFIDTYRSLSQVLHYPVNHKVAFGNNAAKNILKYARDIEADIVLVNPFEETAISRLFGTQITDMPNLKFSILTATPFE